MARAAAKSVRMADIAEKMGVSTVTVSKALGGKEGVSDEVRAQIIELARKMGYPMKEESETESVPSYTVGILNSALFLEKGHSFYWTLYERLLAHMSDQGDFGMLEAVSKQDEQMCVAPRLLKDNRVDALILMGPFSRAYKDALAAFGKPMVILDSYCASDPWDSVISDGYYGMYTATKYLLSMGHREVDYVGRPGTTNSITDRYHGYCRAMEENGYKVTEKNIIPDRDAGFVLQIHWEDIRQPMPTAFVCNCDNSAYLLLNLLKEKGIRVPEDVSIMGFDNFVVSQMAVPPITTYAVDQDGMAKASLAQLHERILHPDALRQFAVVTGYLVERDSVARMTDEQTS